jgi:hypothetical protein
VLFKRDSACKIVCQVIPSQKLAKEIQENKSGLKFEMDKIFEEKDGAKASEGENLDKESESDSALDLDEIMADL